MQVIHTFLPPIPQVTPKSLKSILGSCVSIGVSSDVQASTEGPQKEDDYETLLDMDGHQGG